METYQWPYTQEKLFSFPYSHQLPIATPLGVEQNEPLSIFANVFMVHEPFFLENFKHGYTMFISFPPSPLPISTPPMNPSPAIAPSQIQSLLFCNCLLKLTGQYMRTAESLGIMLLPPRPPLPVLFNSILGPWGILPLGLGLQGRAPFQSLLLGPSLVGQSHNLCVIFTTAHLLGRTNCRLKGLWLGWCPSRSTGSLASYQRVSTQQLLGTDAETHSQTFGGAQGIL